MKTKLITYLSVAGILLIILSQGYIVYENYNQTRIFLTRESNVILEEAFSNELNLRNSVYEHLRNTAQNIKLNNTTSTVSYDVNNYKELRNNIPLFVKLVVNDGVSKLIPINLHNLDSITEQILESKKIYSKFIVHIIDNKTHRILNQSKESFHFSFFLISSTHLNIDLENKRSLQLVLINPFASIFKRMGTLLVSSFLLALFCSYGLWFLFQTLARQKKLMEVKNDFFGNTAHELKRPVAQLHLALDALARSSIYSNDTKRERYLAISKEATRDMSEKITMIMTLSMAEEGVFKLNYSEFNVLEEVQKLKDFFSMVAGKDVNIEMDAPPDDYSINADRDHLRQCMANLLDNAIKYSGSSVRITISLQKQKDALNMSFKDNGIGIAPEKIKLVFEKYTRLNTNTGTPSGFGIGLSYVKTVIEKHAGRIEVNSELGKGSEFLMVLPA